MTWFLVPDKHKITGASDTPLRLAWRKIQYFWVSCTRMNCTNQPPLECHKEHRYRSNPKRREQHTHPRTTAILHHRRTDSVVAHTTLNF